ncbi:hypothetical protein Droror1_Dr00012084, partial [Drosera rotundifolia]
MPSLVHLMLDPSPVHPNALMPGMLGPISLPDLPSCSAQLKMFVTPGKGFEARRRLQCPTNPSLSGGFSLARQTYQRPRDAPLPGKGKHRDERGTTANDGKQFSG